VSEPLVVKLPHKLGKEEALRRIKPALGKASSSFPMLVVEEEAWSGDRMTFRVRALRQAAAGSDDVKEHLVGRWFCHMRRAPLQAPSIFSNPL
jgi:hypothetical protein